MGSIRYYGRYVFCDGDGKRTLKCILHALGEMKAYRHVINKYINTTITKIESDYCKVIAYSGTLQELQQAICTIIKDAGKQWDYTLYPRINGNKIYYYTLPADDQSYRYKMCVTIDEINSKPAQKLMERWREYGSIDAKICAISISGLGLQKVKPKKNKSFREYIDLLVSHLPKTYQWSVRFEPFQGGRERAEITAMKDGEDVITSWIDDDPNINLDESQIQHDVDYIMEDIT